MFSIDSAFTFVLVLTNLRVKNLTKPNYYKQLGADHDGIQSLHTVLPAAGNECENTEFGDIEIFNWNTLLHRAEGSCMEYLGFIDPFHIGFDLSVLIISAAFIYLYSNLLNLGPDVQMCEHW